MEEYNRKLLILHRDELLTRGDLEDFKIELLHAIRQLSKEITGTPSKLWLKSYEVRELLGISGPTLQAMRDKGTIPFTRIGGAIFYYRTDIEKMMEQFKKNPLKN
ncbi:helix-turn-helix domain-containing protein [Rhizosphaericola mali]|uniref:Helix-turn-helix domain-containing protein n=1 Tax=Rhizosphaericola mali TaxID=2545455 RepID=A0A5P2G136_9BACT|nr:helix-turn-helix domain-containing protein [Rhizosphaericola mali]QES88897.1 helix-turn-helix domain-containing protein [Rhizosphaericola mali]